MIGSLAICIFNFQLGLRMGLDYITLTYCTYLPGYLYVVKPHYDKKLFGKHSKYSNANQPLILCHNFKKSTNKNEVLNYTVL